MSQAAGTKLKKVRPQLHVTALNTFGDCPHRFERRYILGEKRPPNAFLLVGSSVDEGVSTNLDNKIKTGELLGREDVVEIARASFDERLKKEPIELEADEKRDGKSLETVLGEAVDKTVDLTGLHCDAAAPVIQPKETRRKFSIDMSKWLRKRATELRATGAYSESKYAARILEAQAVSLNAAARDGLDLVGEQDIVEAFPMKDSKGEYARDALVIRDTKTSAKSPTRSLMDGADSPGAADDSEQLTGYAAASYVLDGRLPDAMVLDYLVKTNAKTPTIKYVPTATRRTMEDVNVFLNRVVAVIHAIHEGVFPPTNASDWKCSQKWCGYWEVCPYAKHPTLITIQTQAK